MLSNPGRLREMGARGRTMVRQKYDPMTVAGRMLDVYREILHRWNSGAKKKQKL
jgi:glycosyltransferase involved in cell wall biosynthesis